ncbi:UDP-2,3-diacylglucosamine diphosphatase [Hydrogenophaga sp. 5NK40-0174]
MSGGASSAADALFILGDLFEVWIGDDCLASAKNDFLRSCIESIRECATQIPVYFMAGNRDFLLGPDAAKAANMTWLPDPAIVTLGDQRIVLTHGDALCTDDVPYQAFRRQVRSSQWQSDFLAKPLTERAAIARGLREASKAQQAKQYAEKKSWADVNDEAALDWLEQANATTLIHGHTHHANDHPLPGGRMRVVLSDWDANASPPRAQVLKVMNSGAMERQDIPAKVRPA